MPARQELANAIRALSMDAVERAQSGHPGAPLGLADLALVLWHDFLRHNPSNPHWPNRDRFVLSNGHASMLLYSLLHLTGYDLAIADLQKFRQLHSKTPGHPEFGLTPGVETTTGPLGQGLANGVGFAIAETMLSASFNRPEFPLIDHYTYVFVGDGDLMEGISHEVCSLAGTLKLSKLIVFWDDNGISIDGEVRDWFSENVPERFRAYNWRVIADVDGHDFAAITKAIELARSPCDRPTLICCKTKIGFGAPSKVGTAEVHGSPLGAAEVAAAREKLNWHYPPFVIPKEIYAAWNAVERGQQLEAAWQKLFKDYQQKYPELAQELQRRLDKKLPKNWQASCESLLEAARKNKIAMATRKASLLSLNALAPNLPELIGGSADLSVSNLTFWSGAKAFSKADPAGNYIFYGVREFGMSAIINGLALYGGFIPFGGTFLTFSDYARNAVRLSALLRCRSIFVYTHDSVGLGEDGPTHQPVEHLAMLRLTPNLMVWRPADYTETAVAWAAAIELQGPSCLVFSRQNLLALEHSSEQVAQMRKGGYILWEPEGEVEAIIIATGSEVELALQAAQKLRTEKNIRVVSMPSSTVFLQQSREYQEQILPPLIKKRLAVEAAASEYWRRFVGDAGKIIGIDRFGESAPAAAIFQELGFSVEHVVEIILSL